MPDRGPPAARLALSDPSLAAGRTGRGGWSPIRKEWLPTSKDRPPRSRPGQGAASAPRPRGTASCGRADEGAGRSEGSARGRRDRGRRRRGPRRAPGKSYDRLNGAAVAGHAPYPPRWERGRRALHKLAQGRLRSAVPSPSDCTPERRVRRGRDSLSRATRRPVPEASWTRVRGVPPWANPAARIGTARSDDPRRRPQASGPRRTGPHRGASVLPGARACGVRSNGVRWFWRVREGEGASRSAARRGGRRSNGPRWPGMGEAASWERSGGAFRCRTGGARGPQGWKGRRALPCRCAAHRPWPSNGPRWLWRVREGGERLLIRCVHRTGDAVGGGLCPRGDRTQISQSLHKCALHLPAQGSRHMLGLSTTGGVSAFHSRVLGLGSERCGSKVRRIEGSSSPDRSTGRSGGVLPADLPRGRGRASAGLFRLAARARSPPSKRRQSRPEPPAP